MHTPTPWRVSQNKRHIVDEDGLIVVYPGGSRPEKAAQANAAYIVHSANAYPRLVKALQEIDKYLVDDDQTLHQYADARALLRELGE